MKLRTSFWTFILCSNILAAQTHPPIQSFLNAYAEHGRLSGTVLVQQAGQTIFQGAYGCADFEESQANTLATVFNIGSLSKQFTAAAILHLVAADKIDLQHSINDYLGKYTSENWQKVTVHQLLTHTSGIPSLLQSGQGLDDVFPEERAVSLTELIGYFRDLKLLAKPGKKYRYNNSGYVLLAAIIEEVSGQSYEQYLQQTLFDPYGLTQTSHSGSIANQLAFPHYNYTEAQRKKAPAYHPSWFIGAGSIYSNIVDLARWNSVIHGADFLNGDLREAYFQAHEATGNGNAYAYGWQVLRSGDQKFIHHDGTTFGYTCDFLYEPKTRNLSIILTNQTHESLALLGKSEDFIRQTNKEILQSLNGGPLSKLPQLQSSNKQIREGQYQLEEDYNLTIQEEEGQWMITATDISPFSYAFERPLILETSLQQRAGRAVEALAQKHFWKFAKEADGTLKTLSYLGMMRLGMNMVMKGMGKWQRAVLYDQEDRVFFFRIFCENGSVDFSLHFNEKDQVQGVFDFSRSGKDKEYLPKKLPAKITETGLYLNGFAYGDADVELVFSGDQSLLFRQRGREFKGRLIEQ